MGSAVAAGYAEGVAEGLFSLESAVAGHLLSNFFPPHPRSMIAPAVLAINKVNSGDTSRVRTPFEHRVYGKLVPPKAVVEALKLWHFIDVFEDEEDWD